MSLLASVLCIFQLFNVSNSTGNIISQEHITFFPLWWQLYWYLFEFHHAGHQSSYCSGFLFISIKCRISLCFWNLCNPERELQHHNRNHWCVFSIVIATEESSSDGKTPHALHVYNRPAHTHALRMRLAKHKSHAFLPLIFSHGNFPFCSFQSSFFMFRWTRLHNVTKQSLLRLSMNSEAYQWTVLTESRPDSVCGVKGNSGISCLL